MNTPSLERVQRDLDLIRSALPADFPYDRGSLALGVARPERRNFLGWGPTLASLGLAMPWIPSRAAFWAVGGAAITLGGLVSTLVLWRQLRQWEAAHGGD